MDRWSDVVLNENGRVVPGASILILDAAQQPATLFSNRTGTPTANPLTTDALGKFSFCAADGIYSADVYVGGVLKASLLDIRLEDPSDGFASLAAPGGAALIGNTPAGTIAATTVQAAINEISGDVTALTASVAAGKDASGGYPGLTGYSINFKNAAGTFMSYMANANTASRTYTFKDASGTVAFLTDIPAAYSLPIASASVLGGIKVGANLSIDGAGVLSASNSYVLPTAAAGTLGGVKVGSGLSIDGAGVLSASGGGGTGTVTAVNSISPVAGNVSLTSNDIPENTNLYFTTARVLATALAGLSTATNAAITAADTVLTAAGKLQKQITDLIAAKDASGGYAGLTLFKLNMRNVANTFTSFLTNTNTAARTYTFPDADGTVAMTSDLGRVLLAVVTPTAAANVDFLNVFSATYDEYEVIGRGITSSASDSLSFRLATLGTTVNTSSVYGVNGTISGSGDSSMSAAGTSVQLAPAPGAGYKYSVRLELSNVNATTADKAIWSRVINTAAGPSAFSSFRQIGYYGAAAVTGVRLFWSGGATFGATGYFLVFGIRKV